MESLTMSALAALLLVGIGAAASAEGQDPPDLRTLAGQAVEGTDLHWKYAEAVVEWGFEERTGALAYDGWIASTYTQGKVGPLALLPGDAATALTGDLSWTSRPAGRTRRGIVVPLLYTDTAIGPGQTVVTVRTSSGGFSFRPIDLESGPILAPELGFYVAPAAGAMAAADFQRDLAAKGLKTIRQRVREHPEQTWLAAVKALNEGRALPPFPKAPYEPAMSVEVPDPNLQALWRIGAWQILKCCPRIDREDVRKVGKADLFTKQIFEQCRIIEDPKDPRGMVVVPDHPFAPLGIETDRILWALDHLGMHEAARDGISVWLENQRADGALTLGSDIDTRQHQCGALNIPWVMIEHYRLTGDREWLKKESPRLQAAVRWMLDRRKTTMKETLSKDEAAGLQAGTWPPYGLQPRISMGDGDPNATRCYIVNDLIAYRAIRMVGEAVSEIDPPAGGRLLQEAARYREDIARVLEQAIVQAPLVRVKDGTYRSYIPLGIQDHGIRSRLAPKGTDVFGHCGIYCSDITGPSDEVEYALKTGLLALDDPRVDGLFDVLEDVLLTDHPWLRKRKKDYESERDWFSNAGWGYQAGWERLPEYYLAKDDIPNFIRQFMNHCAVDINVTNGRWTFNEHTTFADNDKSFENAIFLTNFRHMLVWENGPALWLARATPRGWLAQGNRIAVKNAPTYFGAATYEIVSDVDHGRLTATISIPSRQAPKEVLLRLRRPDARPIRNVTVNGKPWKAAGPDPETIRLTGLSGTVTVVVADAP